MNLSNFITLSHVFVVPDFHVNLLSVDMLCKYNKCRIVFNENSCVVHGSMSKVTVVTGKESGGLYYLDNKSLGRYNFVLNNSKLSVCKLTWHNRLRHLVNQALNVLQQVLNFGNESILTCEVHHKAKQTREPFLLSEH